MCIHLTKNTEALYIAYHTGKPNKSVISFDKSSFVFTITTPCERSYSTNLIE